jgi:microcystin-dependent protein
MANLKTPQSIDIDQSTDAQIPTGALVIIGGLTYSTTSIDTLGMCPCDGRAISRTTYANLFNVIGTTWGVGNGSTTFNVPNFSTGYNLMMGAEAGAALGTSGGSLSHTHDSSTAATAQTSSSSIDHTHTYAGATNYSGNQYHDHYLGAFYMYNSGTPSPTVFKSDGAAAAAAINHAHSGYIPGLGWGLNYGDHFHSTGGNLDSTSQTSHSHTMTVNAYPDSATDFPPSNAALFYIKL